MKTFFCGTLPSILRASGGLQCGLGFAKAIFLGIWIWQNRDLILPPAGGVWGGMRAGVSSDFGEAGLFV